MNEKLEFSTRLRKAMADAGYEARAVVIEREFNRRWWGRSISQQAAWSWLNAKSIPAQDKMQVLAEWLKIEPHLLRFGEAVARAVRDQRKRWDEGVGFVERETFDAFLTLPAPQRKVIREVIMTFAQVHKSTPGRK